MIEIKGRLVSVSDGKKYQKKDGTIGVVTILVIRKVQDKKKRNIAFNVFNRRVINDLKPFMKDDKICVSCIIESKYNKSSDRWYTDMVVNSVDRYTNMERRFNNMNQVAMDLDNDDLT